MNTQPCFLAVLTVLAAAECLSAQVGTYTPTGTSQVMPRTELLPRKSDGIAAHYLFTQVNTKGPGVLGITQNHFYVDAAASGSASAIAFRRAFPGWWPNQTGPFPSLTVDLELAMGHTPTRPPRQSFKFSKNRGIDHKTVANRKVISFPSLPRQTSGPYPFSYRIPFDTPFTLTANRWAMWELTTYSASKFTWPNGLIETHALELATWIHPTQWGKRIGFNCPSGTMENTLGGTPPLVLGAGTPIRMELEFGSGANTSAHLFLGLSSRSWGGLPPMPLSSLVACA